MCGLFGYYSFRSAEHSESVQSRLLAAKCALYHRGPDDCGLETFSILHGFDVFEGSLSLGHTRLSIIDLSLGGHQPMHSNGGRYTIVFNGEIYNYRELRSELKGAGFAFYTDSDTEVLLAAWEHWGSSGLSRLIGMFAFVVYDRQDQSLTMVRDAFGIKPLFYSSFEGTISFASELPALLELLPFTPDLDLDRVGDFLVFGQYDDSESTFYRDIKTLSPGHYVRIDLQDSNELAPRRWWWPSIKERADLSFEDAACQLRAMFLNSVRMHMRSDVAIGATLSGGIDSSAIVCAMRYLDPEIDIHTFTYVARGLPCDEERWADIVNAHVNAIPHKVIIGPNDLLNDLDALIHTQGEPFGTVSVYAQYRVFKLAKECGISVILDGQGADESLGGYDGYPVQKLRDLLDDLNISEVRQFLTACSRSSSKTGTNLIIRLIVSFFSNQFKHSLSSLNPMQKRFPSWINKRALPLKYYRKPLPPLMPDSQRKRRHLANRLRHDLTSGRLKRLLRYADRNAMTFSIENRVPFLTTEISEFLLSLPSHYLVSSDGVTKRIFRAAMRGIVPDVILDRSDKVGFEAPLPPWLGTEFEVITKMKDKASTEPLIKSDELKGIYEKTIISREITPEFWRLISYLGWKK